MKNFYVLQIVLFIFLPYTSFAARSSQLNSICDSFAAGEIDAYQTLEALKLNIEDFSIGVNNTARIFCR